MTAPHTSRQNSEQVFVEVIGPDGLAHHVGPFKTSAQAEEWIVLNSGEMTHQQKKSDQKMTVAIGGNVLLKPTD
jgi:hypothetical protein